jgi:hypothetical protein
MSVDYTTIKRTRVIRTTAQAILTSTTTAISWGSAPVDEIGGTWSAGAPASIIAPSSGYSRFRATWLTNWDQNLNGVRQNYLGHVGVANLQCDISDADVNMAQRKKTRWFPVTGGMTIELHVRQNSGSTVNLKGTNFTEIYMEIEWAV